MKTRFREAREKKMDAKTDRVVEHFVLTKQVEDKSPKTTEWYGGMLGQFDGFLIDVGHSRRVRDVWKAGATMSRFCEAVPHALKIILTHRFRQEAFPRTPYTAT
jgi:hypothetical protein